MNTPENMEAQPLHNNRSRRWRWSRRILLGLAIVMTFLALAHAVENWRGKRAWGRCKRELAAKGEVLEWAAYIPPRVPDEENVFKAPKMREWFVRDAQWFRNETRTANQSNGPFQNQNASQGELEPIPSLNGSRVPTVFAYLRIVAETESSSGNPDIVLGLADADLRGAAEPLLQKRAGRLLVGAAHGWFVAEAPDASKPLRINVVTTNEPTLASLKTVIPPDQSGFWSAMQFVQETTNSFRIQLGNQRVCLAADYLAWSDPNTNDLNTIRKALLRSRVQIEGDYDPPFERPIPNFVSIRTVAQRLSERAQCHLLLDNPEAALGELTLLHELSRLLEPEPTTLVAAMIDVAVTGLYTSVIQDGLRLKAWHEPQLIELQRQLGEIHLIGKFLKSLRTERAAVCHTIEISTAGEFSARWGQESSPLERLRDNLVSALVPRGWLDQNRAALALYEQRALECFDTTNQVLVQPGDVSRLSKNAETRFNCFNPYTFFARIAVPNYGKASTIAARNQALVGCALAACALERHRADHGGYPDTLDQLLPRSLTELPRDPMTGTPLNYRRTTDFVLYSVGWNQRDEGGAIGKAIEEGDWVWR